MSIESDKPLYLQHDASKPAEGALPFESVPFDELVAKARKSGLQEPEGGWREEDRKTLYNLTSLSEGSKAKEAALEQEKEHKLHRDEFMQKRAEQKAELEIQQLMKAFRSRIMNAWKVLIELAKGNTNVDVKGALITIVTMYWQMSSLQGRTKAEKIEKIKEFLERSEPEMAAIEEQVRQYEAQLGIQQEKAVKKPTEEDQLSELAKKQQQALEAQMRQYGIEQGIIYDTKNDIAEEDLAA